ncbi:hypothetical protein MTES_2189 [Microbacterium testaceum StLB037]|uniref:Glycosyltransferase n=1 Tax=Microbacterium testaceum (strain StLB037) TaxID=979556 RepID=E8NER8_MICTS|nr:hypothetical protein [Microbacterium testaceum]BAJ75153.1 hypothetical protein MTES_2189 [Microbacterium testaceum StLB037]
MYTPQDFSVVSPVNEPVTLERCLAASPDIVEGTVPLRTVADAASASLVIEAALRDAATAFVVYAHQDVYFPRGFFRVLADRLTALDAVDPRWAVAGAIGRDARQRTHGTVWSTDRGMVVGTVIDGPRPVDCLDECLLVLRAGDLSLVDTALPGFHLYGVDLVQMGKDEGRSSYALPLNIVHHAKPITSLGGGYAEGHRYMRRKWGARLPLTTLIAPLERIPWKLWKMRVGAWVRTRTVRAKHGYGQSTDPRAIARELAYE